MTGGTAVALTARLAAARATGALHTSTGTVYLVHGAVVHAESPQSLGIGELLTGCGRITADRWQRTLELHGPLRQVGRALVEQGSLSRGELELCHLQTLYDAAYFALDPDRRPICFEPEVRHWLGPVRQVSPPVVCRETLRRRDLLARIWPCPELDTAPVECCTGRTPPALSRRRRELLDLADGRRTAADLARLLGRSSFATAVEIRRLAAAGLVRSSDPAPAVPPPRHPLPPRSPQPPAGPPLEARRRHAAPDPAAPTRRTPGASLHRSPEAAELPDTALLLRVRSALEARL
ncbi:transcriptional regulator [Kitasatospora sp. NPDC058965]|uniref:transcriptional regulator n=1 Tax=Kitasatospora sp. NPDC058965 TaxID=3346682 RepID=UPI0036B1B68D